MARSLSHSTRSCLHQKGQRRATVAFCSWLGVALMAMLPLGPTALAQPGISIPLPEPQGQTLLMQSVDRADYGPLAEQFLTQANPAYCGVASMVMVLNSL
ncbi:hypothetical protein KBY88_05080, partial [Cyanobium sp. Morenito 9A2]|nr:hypothetical protein [Cyanobium sp. Morenito 9A2]